MRSETLAEHAHREEVSRRRKIRKAAGERINPETAVVWFVYAQTLDPYGDFRLPPEYQQIGREWFAADPSERIAVHVHDLPQTTRDALEERRRDEDWQGGAELFDLLR